ncbi:Holliday junction resolvase RuvX [soil metagenome]
MSLGANSEPSGPILGIDPGAVRVGVAAGDLATRWARPIEVVDRRSVDAIARIAQLVEELSATRVVVGRPNGLAGRAGPAVAEQERFVADLRAALACPVEEYDERFTTVIAAQGLRVGGAGRRRRAELLDAVAAQVMLQGYLDAAR